MQTIEWTHLIQELQTLRVTVQKADTENLYDYLPPNEGASEQQLQKVEQQLGHRLDEQYRSFLLAAGGWPSFLGVNDLFDPGDLLGGKRHERAREFVSYLDEDRVFEIDERMAEIRGLRSADFLPIAVSQFELDVFVLGRPGSSIEGQVFWFAAYLIEHYPSFLDFFRAIMQLHEYDLQEFSHRSEQV